MNDPGPNEGQPETGQRLREHTEERGDDTAIDQVAALTRRVLDYMSDAGLDLPIFLDAVFWGNDRLATDGKTKYQRSAFLRSAQFPRILERWEKKSSAAKVVLKAHALSTIKVAVNAEMDDAVSELTITSEEIHEENLLSITQEHLVERLKPVTSTLWEILDTSATRKDKSRNKHIHSPGKVRVRYRCQMECFDHDAQTISFVICQLAFRRNRRANTFQKFLALYLKGCGLAARAFDTLSSLGVTTSQKWAFTGIGHIVESAQEEYVQDVRRRQFLITHDNVNIPFRVYEPTVNQQSHFDSGTAATLYTFPQTEGIVLDAAALQESRRSGRTNPIDGGTIFTVGTDANTRIRPRFIHWILRFLLEAPEFDVNDYKYRDSEILKSPPAVNQLQWGELHKATQYVLPTVHIDESTYEGNEEIVKDVLERLGFRSVDELKEVGSERIIVWVGDQLTVSRLRGLQNLHSHDWNAFERMEWMIPMFGWFHLQMAFANSLHAQYYGSKATLGFSHAFDILQRKGLHSTSTQGTFHHTFEEALFTVGVARFRDVWRKVAGTEDLKELRKKSAAELYDLAVNIWESYASTAALVRLGQDDNEDSDKLLPITIRFNRDLLDYFELDEATRVGDVGRMEDMLPRLLFRFIGGGNHKYAVEILELLQGLHREWTEEVR